MPVIHAFEGHAFQPLEPPLTTSILRPCALPISDLTGLAAPWRFVLFEVAGYGLGRGFALRAGPRGWIMQFGLSSMRVLEVVKSYSRRAAGLGF
jgi:hypothetical protein